MLAKTARLRRRGVLLIDQLVKEAQPGAMHPMETMQRGARYNVGLNDLGSEFGLDTNDSMAQQRALASNPEYYARMRALYDQYMLPPQQAAAEEAPAIDTATEPETKVIAPPK